MPDMPTNETDAAQLVASHLALADKHLVVASPVTASLEVVPASLAAEITRRLDEVSGHVDALRAWINAVSVAAV